MSGVKHFRRCHVCGYLSVQDDHPVLRCGDCGKSLAPFFYFDDRITDVLSDTTVRPERTVAEYFPIQGLTVYWEGF